MTKFHMQSSPKTEYLGDDEKDGGAGAPPPAYDDKHRTNTGLLATTDRNDRFVVADNMIYYPVFFVVCKLQHSTIVAIRSRRSRGPRASKR